MIDFFLAYKPLFDLFLLQTGFAFSQYVVLRAGVFSVATAGFASIGAYCAAILTTSLGVPPVLAIAAGTLAGIAIGFLLSVPLARLRGVYQAIATLAFVQIVLAFNLFADGLTGGAMGISNIPNVVGTPVLLLAVLAVFYLLSSMNRTRLGRAFEAIRQDEVMAASLGISVVGRHAVAFGLSGGIGAFFGALEAFHSYAIEANQFGFTFLVTILSYVVLGGRRSVFGPIVGAALLISLPELARPLADNRILVYGLLLMAVIAFVPRGIVDTWIDERRRRRIVSFEAELARESA